MTYLTKQAASWIDFVLHEHRVTFRKIQQYLKRIDPLVEYDDGASFYQYEDQYNCNALFSFVGEEHGEEHGYEFFVTWTYFGLVGEYTGAEIEYYRDGIRLPTPKELED